MARIAVLGADGYTGWPLVCHLLERGDDVLGVDNMSRRVRAEPSVTPIEPHATRAEVANEVYDGAYTYLNADLRYENIAKRVVEGADAIVNLAQIPSAPWSMQSLNQAWLAQENNVRGSLNLLWALRESDRRVPMVQLATMGEYGIYPDGVPIPEGFLADGRPAPKSPGSFYHISKVQATLNTRFAAETWDLPITEVYQGIVYGLPDVPDERLQTRFDVDEAWGTVLNRFTAQAAAGEPLTVYGAGGQKRAMLPLKDCIRCITLLLDNPSEDGYRAANQFQGSHRVLDLADMVADATGASIQNVDNPRAEDDSNHYYDVERQVLDDLGYEPSESIEETFSHAYGVVRGQTDRINIESLRPSTEWR